ncbi:MAG: flagellar motor protein MotB [Proteobacteria bacterium]|nr:flagellar motor protein MotB [Pseudomonadota bacterium]
MSTLEVAKKESAGLPAWVMTFADLMMLLMSFFVLLLSFSEMDAAKFKQLAGSMKDAFGVQAEIEARTIPKGTSVIAREFSPGRPDPTATNQIRQFTIDSSKNSLDALSKEMKELEEARKHARRIREALRAEILKGSISIQVNGAEVIIHILERASFASGNADIRPAFVPILRKISALIVSEEGTITVSGHTDNVPISNSHFRSNWELSTSRAVSVAHELLKSAPLDQKRFVVVGHADTRPQADNDTAENRAKNRRVDIAISRGGKPIAGQSMSIVERLTTNNIGSDTDD